MKKYISLVMIFTILLLALISIGPPVKAKQEIQQTEYEAIDIYGNQLPNSKYINGLYEKGLLISPYDFIFEDLSEEQKENAFFSFSGFDDYMYLSYNSGTAEEIEIAKQNFMLRTGMSEDGTYHFPFFYITSIKDFESYLIDSGYIREGETWKHIDISEFGSRLEILERLEEKKLGYLISKNNIPGYLFREYLLSSTENILNIDYIYEIDLGYELYIINQKISHSISIDSSQIVANEECKIKDIPNSLGKITAISTNKFRYTYSLIKYDETLGYYIVSQELSNSIDFEIYFCPSFIFDSAGNLKDNYVSVRDGRWYEPKVSDIFKEIRINYCIEKERYYSIGIISKAYFDVCVAYFSFKTKDNKEFPIDTIESIELNYKLLHKTWLTDFLYDKFGLKYSELNYTCSLSKSSTVKPDEDFLKYMIRYKFCEDFEKENISSIQKGNYRFEDGKYNYSFKLYLNNDEDGSYEIYEDWVPSQNLQIMKINVSYKSVIYDLKNINEVNDKPIIDNDGDTLWILISRIFKEFWENLNPYFKLIIIFILIILLIYLFWPIIKIIFKFLIKIFKSIFNFIKSLFKKKKE